MSCFEIPNGSDSVIGTTLNQRFLLEVELGRGGMGAVYRATDQVLERRVAIKVLKEQNSEEVTKRIRLEAQILARLLHDNVVRLYDFGEANGTWFLVMEEVDGTSYLKRWRKVSLAERLRILAGVAEALDYSHHQGVIHRDLKPGNVLLTASDQPKLSDFGLSVIAEHATESGPIRGTPHYMSPEQASGARLDYRTDLYSLGVMLYENAVGSAPFSGQSLSVIAQHVNKAPDRPRERNRDVSVELEDLILKLLAKNPEKRPGSGSEVARLIRAELDRELARAGSSGSVAQVGLSSLDRATLEAGHSSLDMEETRPFTPATDHQRPVSMIISGPAQAEPTVSGGTASLLKAETPSAAPPIARNMLDKILAEPIALTAEERYLCGHYLAFLLGGSRRKGLFLRRPLDPLNADRARLLLAMTWLGAAGLSKDTIDQAAELLETQPDVRPSLSPIVVAKYLQSRDSPAKTKKFRQARKQLLAASPYAQEHLKDDQGLLNPGLMPAALSDLNRVAPERTEVDDDLVNRWNAIAQVWRDDAAFRNSVLHYATSHANRDPASIDLWPEVVYPLIERVRWQRQTRSRTEALWDNLCAHLLRRPDAGTRLDRAFQQAVPKQVVVRLDAELDSFEDEPSIDMDQGIASPRQSEPFSAHSAYGKVDLDELVSDQRQGHNGLVRLAKEDPYRFDFKQLRALWQEAILALRTSRSGKSSHQFVPIGPYRLVVVASVRGRSAGQVAIQGMPNKQIEMLTPSMRTSRWSSPTIVAVWIYQDQSMVLAYQSFKKTFSYILWHAPNSQQLNFEESEALRNTLQHLSMQEPDQLEHVLTRRFRPHHPV